MNSKSISVSKFKLNKLTITIENKTFYPGTANIYKNRRPAEGCQIAGRTKGGVEQ